MTLDNRNHRMCNNCADSIFLSEGEYTSRKGLLFCSEECADHFFSPENLDPTPVDLARELGVEE